MTQQTMRRIESCLEEVSVHFEQEGLTLRVLPLRVAGRGGGSEGEGQGKLRIRRGEEVTPNHLKLDRILAIVDYEVDISDTF